MRRILFLKIPPEERISSCFEQHSGFVSSLVKMPLLYICLLYAIDLPRVPFPYSSREQKMSCCFARCSSSILVLCLRRLSAEWMLLYILEDLFYAFSPLLPSPMSKWPTLKGRKEIWMIPDMDQKPAIFISIPLQIYTTWRNWNIYKREIKK